MSATTPTPVTAHIQLQNGDVAGGTLTFTLSSYDLDGAIVVPAPVVATLDEQGEATVELWPNVAGLRSTHYVVTLATAGSLPAQTIPLGNVHIPESSSVVMLHHLIAIPNVGNAQFVVLASQEAYDALPVKNPNTHYLIPAE